MVKVVFCPSVYLARRMEQQSGVRQPNDRHPGIEVSAGIMNGVLLYPDLPRHVLDQKHRLSSLSRLMILLYHLFAKSGGIIDAGAKTTSNFLRWQGENLLGSADTTQSVKAERDQLSRKTSLERG